MRIRRFSAIALFIPLFIPWSQPFASEASPANACSPEHALIHGGSFANAQDGTRIWYRVAGREDAPVIAYLHGGPGYNSFTFEKSVGPALEARFRVLYLDQRGCGRSRFDGPLDRYGMQHTIEDLEQLRELVGVDRLVLAGHSFGGAVAAEYATRYPAHTAAVIMIDTTHDLPHALEYQVQYIDSLADTEFRDSAERIHAIASAPGAPMNKLGQMYQAVGRLPLQRKLHFANAASQERMEALDRESGLLDCTSGNAIAALAMQGYLDKALPNVARRLDAPTLLIAGSKSHVIGRANIENAAKVWGARVEWIDAGHFVYFERPQEFVAAVERFLTQVGVRKDTRR
jgi:proline iminopeptidase